MVFPLGRHNLSIGAGDLDLGVQAGLVMSLNNIAAHDLASSNTAVVWALWSWKAVLGPAVWPAVEPEESVLLLKTEPEFFALVSLHDYGGIVTEVVHVWLSIGHPGLAHDQDIVAEAEGIWVVSARAEIDIRVVARGLASGRAVKIPFREVLEGFDFLGKCLQEKPELAREDIMGGTSVKIGGVRTQLCRKYGERQKSKVQSGLNLALSRGTAISAKSNEKVN